MIPHHRDTGRRRHHHGLGPAKLFYKSPKQRHHLRLIPGVVVHLPAAGLPCGKLHRMPQPFQHPHHGLACLRKQRVVIASDKQRDSQTNLRGKQPELNSIESIFPQRNSRQVRYYCLQRNHYPATERGFVGPNPFIGVIYHWIGGFASATNFIPFRGIKRWSWEVYWLIQGFAAWIVAPTLLGSIFVPNLFGIIHQTYVTNPRNVWLAFLFGVLWGVGGITFGLAIRYLGIALGYAIALGLCAAFGTVVPPIAHGEFGTILHSSAGQIILLGVLVCVIGVAINGAAGVSKEHEVTPEEKAEAGETDYNFGKGIAIAILAGFMSSFFAFGLDAGKPIGDLAKTQLLAAGKLDLWQNLPVLVVVLWGGFVTNF